MHISSKKAFTMVELIFVIVVIGILAAIAVPKLAATRDDAIIAKAIATIGSVRSALATERQKRILRGDFSSITSLNSTDSTNMAFSTFSADNAGNTANVLEYPVLACTGAKKGCWIANAPIYTYRMPTSGTVDFNVSSSRFECTNPSDTNCQLLTR